MSKKKTFETALSELQIIIEELESGSPSLDTRVPACQGRIGALSEPADRPCPAGYLGPEARRGCLGYPEILSRKISSISKKIDLTPVN